jgi:hypothetical protein
VGIDELGDADRGRRGDLGAHRPQGIPGGIAPGRRNLEVIDGLRRSGYTEDQIRFMISHTPELMVDGDENGRPDVLETGPQVVAQPPPQISNPAYNAPRQVAAPPAAAGQGGGANRANGASGGGGSADFR